jgi:RNA polymerase sigma factor (sigma-70 family)
LDIGTGRLHYSGMTAGPDRLGDSGPRGFPETRLSLVEALVSGTGAERERAIEALATVYWRPVYCHLRSKWHANREDAEDLTQEFFAGALLSGLLAGYDPHRARFRTYLRGCVDHLAANARRAASRLKRGGGVVHLSLDFAGAERDLHALADAGAGDADARFHAEWVRALFAAAVGALRERAVAGGHEVRFRLFERCDLEPMDDVGRPSYRELAEEFGLPVTQVTNHLAWARREFRRLVLEQLRAISGSDAEFRAEARELLGVEPA